MTYEEAKAEILTTSVMVLESIRKKRKFEKAIRKAIEALEKQIPKKVIYHDNCGNLTPNQPRCPRCYEASNDTWHWAGESYCEYCGQLMKWRK